MDMLADKNDEITSLNEAIIFRYRNIPTPKWSNIPLVQRFDHLGYTLTGF